MMVHFFTIVLNGMPFIRYHVEIFSNLPFAWQWHIVEGVALHRHDTAWAKKLGGQIPAFSHENGLSNDGTKEYLDEVGRRYPGKVFIYRKKEGEFWDGKREMVNAPLVNIQNESLLWQVDADELWTVGQLTRGLEMFEKNPKRTSAFFYCHFFVGPNLVISTRETYGNRSTMEWLRVWRYKPGMRWISHEPPRLACRRGFLLKRWRETAVAPFFSHVETEKMGLVFQHFAYATEAQLRFKEIYYGYSQAAAGWKALLNVERFPVRLREFFPWVQDEALVSSASSQGIIPLASPGTTREWIFLRNTD